MPHADNVQPASPRPSPGDDLTATGSARTGAGKAAALDAVADAVGRLRYGAVHLTIHEGRIVQLDVTERQRFG